jgi:pyruvate dehydrogenase E1 component alpha subunit
MQILDKTVEVKLFFDMMRIRMIEEKIAEKYTEQQMRCPVHLSVGQEAIAVGVCSSLEKEDMIMSTHRAHAHYLAKGGSLKAMIAEIYGKKDGCTMGRGGSMHLLDLDVNMMGSTPIVAGSLPVGVGLAFGLWMQGIKDKVVAIFFGEGATEEGVWAECINFASLKQLPVLFICENNFYSVNTRLTERQSNKRDLVKIVEAHGIKAEKGFGNDVEEVYALTKEAVSAIKKGEGPFFLEFSTYRVKEHCGPNVEPFFPKAEVDYWAKNCPIVTYEERLRRKNLLSNDDVVEMKNMIEEEMKEAFAFASSSEYPLFNLEGVYA